jgi:hypothetical protein
MTETESEERDGKERTKGGGSEAGRASGPAVVVCVVAWARVVFAGFGGRMVCVSAGLGRFGRWGCERRDWLRRDA